MSEQSKSQRYTAPPGVTLLKASAPYNRSALVASSGAVEPNPKRTYLAQPRGRIYEAK